MLKIYGKSSSINVRKVLWTCAEIGLEFEREDWGSGFRDTHEAVFVAMNPNALVPVIRDGDFVLWESNSICRYLARQYQRVDLLPVEPQACAQVEHWMDWQATDLNSSWRYPFMSLVRQHADFQNAQTLAQTSLEWHRHMAILEAQLQQSGGSFVLGETFTLADVVLGLSVHRWYAAPLNHPDFPAIQNYYETLGAREGYILYGRNGQP